MPISNPSLLNQTGSATNAGSITSASLSPSANALLVVVFLGADANNGDWTSPNISDTFGDTLTWTQRVINTHSGSTTDAFAGIWTAQLDATPGSGTVTLSWTGNINRQELIVLEIASGFDTSTPITQSGLQDSDFSGSLTLTLGATPDTDGCIIAGVAGRNATNITGDGAYTTLADTPTGSNFDIILQYDNGGADTTWDVAGLSTGTDIGPGAAVAIEIAPAAAAVDRVVDQLFINVRRPIPASLFDI